MSLLALAFVCVSAFGCSMSPQSREEKSNQLVNAERRLQKNPQDTEALSVILEMLKDKNVIARSNAAAALGDLGESMGASIKDRAVPALVDLLRSDNRFDKKAGACALKHFGPLAKDAIPFLRENLVPSESDVAWCSAEALGMMGELAREAVPDLLKVVKNDETQFSIDRTSISEFATKALGGIGPAAKEAVPDLEHLLNHQSAYFRVFVSVALIQIDPNNQKGLDALRELLQDRDVEVRRKTIWSLKDIGVKAKPAKVLIQAAYLKDKDSAVTSAASDLLLILDRR